MSIQVNPQISQQSFDEAVKENIEEFEMTPEEALEGGLAAPPFRFQMHNQAIYCFFLGVLGSTH